MKSKKITIISLLVCLALVLSYLEMLIPPIVPFPGIKLGLSNLPVLIALYYFSWKESIYVATLKVALVATLFTGISGFMYAFTGTVFSLCIMILLFKIGKNSIIGVSFAGGVFHNLGQILMACLILGNIKIIYYFPPLILSGLVSGTLIGIVANLILNNIMRRGSGSHVSKPSI